MEKKSILKQLFRGKTKDYTYTIAFFLIFSFFIFYVIRPNLLTVFEIKSKIAQLKEIDRKYADQIDKIIQVQAVFEGSRDDLDLLQEAIARQPEVNKVLSDVNVSSEGSSLLAERIVISDINLKDVGMADKIKSFVIRMNLAGRFDSALEFVGKIYSQRRLKYFPVIELSSQSNQSTQSATMLKIRLEVEGYYL